MSLITTLADAMQRKEGFFPGSRAYRNNNPGNLWDGIGKGKTARIWPNLPIDDLGFVIYPDYAAGRAALERQLALDISRGLTLENLIAKYAPNSENDTSKYLADVAAWTGLPMGVSLSTAGNQVSVSTPSPPSFSIGRGSQQAARPGLPLPRPPRYPKTT